MQHIFYLSLFLLVTTNCQEKGKVQQSKTFFIAKATNNKLLNKKAKTIKTRFIPPTGFKRVEMKDDSFANYLQNFSLKPHNSKVYLYNGDLKYRQDVHVAVLDIDVGKRDLQQCADATMRLRAEYLYKNKQFDKITFNFTNGFKASYSKWRKGYRIIVKGNIVKWVKKTSANTSYQSFRKYLTMVFSYAGTLSLEKELPKRNIEKLQIGDIFIQGGSPGHAVIVVDLAVNSVGEKAFILAQSYMPAQDIHVVKNPNNANLSPWYLLENLEELVTPEWIFTRDNLKYFN